MVTREVLLEIDPDLLLADGFDDAIIGLSDDAPSRPTCVVYDTAKVIKILMRNGMSHEEAEEYFAFNVSGAWVGERTPIFMRRLP